MKKQEQLAEKALHHSSREKPVQAKLSGSGSGNRFNLSQLGTAQSMPAPVQAKMEESMGADFSGVKLYESPMISDNGAQAVASGKNVAFAPGKLDFSSKAGLGLLGHELSHVASQARGEVSGSGFVNNAALERKADEEGARAASAFDSQSSHTLTPLSGGSASFSSAAPMQAKKGKKEESAPVAEPAPAPVAAPEPQIDRADAIQNADPSTLAQYAAASERANLVAQQARDMDIPDSNYDYAGDQQLLDHAVAKLKPKNKMAFQNALFNQYTDSFSGPIINFMHMQKYSKAYNKATGSYSAMRKYVDEEGFNNMWNAYEANHPEGVYNIGQNIPFYQTAGTDRDDQPQSVELSRQLISEDLARLNRGKLLPWHKRH